MMLILLYRRINHILSHKVFMADSYVIGRKIECREEFSADMKQIYDNSALYILQWK